MSITPNLLSPGDLIFHPKFGFGSIHATTRRERILPVNGLTAGETPADPAEDHEDYYDIHLREGGTLLVPISRSGAVGLRRLTGGLAAVRASMYTAPLSLPADFRERAGVLRQRGQLPEPAALAHTVRDFLAQSRGRQRSAGETVWLEKACQRLSIEAALVDQISEEEAFDAIWRVVCELSVQ